MTNKGIIGAIVGGMIPVPFIAMTWLSPEQREAIEVLVSEGMYRFFIPVLFVVAMANLGYAFATPQRDEDLDKPSRP